LCGLSNDYFTAAKERIRIESMVKKRLGTSDLEITPMGVGAWAMGGGGWQFSWGPQDDAESIAAIHTALDAGVNWIDTAAIYGLGIPKKWWRARWRAAPTSHTSSRNANGCGTRKGRSPGA